MIWRLPGRLEDQFTELSGNSETSPLPANNNNKTLNIDVCLDKLFGSNIHIKCGDCDHKGRNKYNDKEVREKLCIELFTE